MRYGIVGLGISGKALVDILLKLGHKPVVFELKSRKSFKQEEIEKLEKEGVELIFNYQLDDFKKVDLVILSSGIKHDFFKQNKIKFISELDFVCSFLEDKDYIFITGTKGKGTTAIFTKFLFDELGLKTFLGGNIGESEYSKPAVYAIFESADIYLFETSSFQLRSSFQAKPLIYAIVNLGIDHLDRHNSLEDYWQSKLKFLEKAKYWIKPNEFEILKNVPEEFKNNFPGEHNLYDLSLAYRILEVYAKEKNLEIPEDLLAKAVKKFPRQKFVLQYEGEINGVKIYNDSKSTHYLSLKASLNSFNQPVILICGGLTKGFDFSEIEDVIKKKVKYGIIIGRDKEKIAESFDKSRIFLAENLEEAINKALEVSQSGDVILFSPGCASFDMFQNATERGEIFSELIKKFAK
ncbi:MAG: UDP-N-acetylmuramoylalanine--D-glutamate ligase [Candidatus Parcubacteria bacterium]|nr:MAG: UDP-N-acetylmuramoylalanine--D-glutamate ligase [Candidatus Parcubacteria bacterium]